MKYIINQKWEAILKFFTFVIIFFIAGRAGIGENLYPFIFGIYFALIWCNSNIFIVSTAFLLGSYLATFSYLTLLGNLLFCIIFLIIYGIHYKIQKPLKLIHILIYACICNIPTIAINLCFLHANIYLVFVELFLGLLYMFSCMKFFETVCVRGISGRLTSIETICALIFIGANFCGFSSLVFFDYVYINVFIAVALMLIANYVCNSCTTLLISIAMGVGSLLYNNNPLFLCRFVIYGLTVCAFKTKNKYITVVALIASDCFCGFYLGLIPNYNAISLLPIFVAALIYIILPNRILDNLSNKFSESFYSITQQSVINKNREVLYYKLVELSDVFLEMNKVFRAMIGGGIVNEDVKRLLYNEVKNKNCVGCPNQGRCYRVFNDGTNRALNIIIEAGLKKGKVNLLDVPTLFAGKCDKLNALVGSVNDLIDQYKNYAGLMNNIDASKVLLAEQLGGVSQILKELSLDVNKGVNFEKGKERKIIDELLYNNIICSDALVFQDNNDITSVTLAIKKQDSNKNAIVKVVSKVCGHKMEVSDDVSSVRAGWQIITLKSATKYDVVFGIASRTKTGSTKSGDSFSVIKIKDDKYLFAICDGMGSGEIAERTSSTAIGLLENFYKAGFNKEIIISSVNKLLSLGKDEAFSALDLCVIDTRIGVGDFVKMGAPESFVKHKENTDVIKIGALPLGIIQNAESKAKEVYFTSGDKIILCSDGVTDSFKNISEFQDFINNLTSTSPQLLADEILQKVLNNNKNIARDDITIIVVKIFER